MRSTGVLCPLLVVAAGAFACGCAPDTNSPESSTPPETGTARSAIQSAASETFEARVHWSEWICAFNSERCLVGDFTGDGRDDVAAVLTNGAIWVARSNGAGFEPVQQWPATWPSGTTPLATGYELTTGDVNADGKDDIVVFTRGTSHRVHVAFASPSASNPSQGTFGFSANWNTFFAPGSEIPKVGDVNGDGCADVVTFLNDGGGDVYAAKAAVCSDLVTSLFGDGDGADLWHGFFAPTGEKPLLADFDGDGMEDIGTLVPSSGAIYVARSFGRVANKFQCSEHTGCAGTLWMNSGACNQANRMCLAGDFNGDGQADIVELDQSSGATSHRLLASDGTRFTAQARNFVPCLSGEHCLAGDFNGDGKADVAAFKRQTSPQGAAFVTLSGPSRDLPFCTTSRSSGCNGVLTFPANSTVDTDVPVSTISGPNGHTVSMKVWLQYANTDTGAFVTDDSRMIPFGVNATYGVRKHDVTFPGARVEVALKNDAAQSWELSNADLLERRWYHIAVTVSPSNVQRVYIDGTLAHQSVGGATTQTLPAGWNAVTGNLRFGNDTRFGRPLQFYGLLDDVSVYNRELAASEVTALRTKTSWTGTESGLVAAWSFDNFTSAPPPKVDKPVRLRGNAARIAFTAPATESNAILLAGSDSTLVRFNPPLATNTTYFNGQTINRTVGSHRGFAAFAIDLSRSGAASRGGEVRAASRGQPVFVRFDSLDTAGLPPFQNNACPQGPGRCSVHLPNDPISGAEGERMVAGCRPCNAGEAADPAVIKSCVYLANQIILRHGPHQYTEYEHLSEFSVEQAIKDKLACYYDPECTGSSIVESGELIGRIGRSGTKGDHLHFAHWFRPLPWGQTNAVGATTLGSFGQTGVNPLPGAAEMEFGPLGRRSGSIPVMFGGCGYVPSVQNIQFGSAETRDFYFERFFVDGLLVIFKIPAEGAVFTWSPP